MAAAPDVICLQESECQADVMGTLESHGYGVVYERRLGRTDGCLTAYRRSKLSLR